MGNDKGTRIYGASDDLIEFEGGVEGEWGAWNAEPMLACSDGTVLTFRYDTEGVWRATILTSGALYCGTEVYGGDPDDEHSDIVSFQPGLKWVNASNEWERVK